MLIQIGRFRMGVLFKRCLFHCTVNCSEAKAEECVPQLGDNQISRTEELKFLKVAILGLPNAGKSTLINSLVQRTICPTSSKIHTTTHKASAVYSEGNTQIVFMDTPGLTTKNEMKRFNLNESFKKDPTTSVIDADVIGILQDTTNPYTRYKISSFVVNRLIKRNENTSLILILNKIDKIKDKKMLLQLTDKLTKNKYIPKFDDIFMISALTGDGVDDLRNYLLDCAKKNQWQYEQNLYTDQSPESIVRQTVRAKLLDLLPADMPYIIQVDLQHYDVNEEGNVSCVILLKCPRKQIQNTLLKRNGENVKLAAVIIEKELRHAFKTNVTIRLIVVTFSKEQNCYI